MTEVLFRGRSKTLKIILNIIGLAGVLFLILKAPYGFGTTDECYYLITPLRFVGGDALLVDEWFVAQLFGAVLFPLLKLYMLIVGSTEGIILVFRYIYIAVKVLAAVYIYRRLKKDFSILPSFAFAFLFMIYSPYDIMALSYNSIGLIAFSMAVAAFVTLKEKEHVTNILAGFLFAVAVLCCPYLIAVYVLYALAVLTVGRTKNMRSEISLKLSTFGKVTAGAGICAVLFAVLVFTRASLSEIIKTLPYILSDPTHQNAGILDSFTAYYRSITNWEWKRGAILLATLLLGLLFALVKQLKKLRILAFAAMTAMMLIYIFWPGYPMDNPNFFIFPLNILGLGSFLLSEKKRYRLFFGAWVSGVVYSFAMNLSSNQGFYVISSATLICSMASIVIIPELLCEMAADFDGKAMKHLLGIFGVLLFACQMGVISYFIAVHCFWDGNASTLSRRIEKGCEKGVITSEEFENDYYGLWDESTEFREKTDGRVIYVTNKKLWLLLDDKKLSGSCFSYYAWEDEHTAECLEAYYEIRPERRAKYLFVDKYQDVTPYISALDVDTESMVRSADGNTYCELK